MMSDEKQAIHVIAEAIAKPGQEEALYRTLHACVAPTRAEPGNRGYILASGSG
jgi:quinol monooxygenase YgiN